MSRKWSVGGLGFISYVLLSSVLLAANPDQAAKFFSEGNSLLQKGDFDAAVDRFAAAAKADPKKPEYRQELSLLKRVMKMNKALDREKNLDKWSAIARGLHAYYVEKGLLAEALKLDTRFHDKVNTAESAALLAEIQIALGRNAQAEKVLTSLPAAKTTPQTQALLGLAQARQDEISEAKAAASKAQITSETESRTLFILARLYARVGEAKKAVNALVQSFEKTPPDELAPIKQFAQTAPDFKTISSTPEFANALKTESKVKVSPCSGGSDCGKCPRRAGCGSAK